MKHDWEPIHTAEHPFSLLSGSVRRCKNCGAFQEYVEVAYDRIAGSTYRWRPLVGQCAGMSNIDEANPDLVGVLKEVVKHIKEQAEQPPRLIDESTTIFDGVPAEVLEEYRELRRKILEKGRKWK